MACPWVAFVPQKVCGAQGRFGVGPFLVESCF